MNKVNSFFVKRVLILIVLLVFSVAPVSASPYGVGKYGADVPYGKDTSITISAGNVSLTAVPSNSGNVSTANGSVTVFSTDTVGYKLYIQSTGSTNLAATSDTIPASANGAPAALVTNTWGYNTNASTNFIGITSSNVEIKNFVGPARLGDTTTVTFGVKLDFTKKPGSYTTTVLYTAAPQTT